MNVLSKKSYLRNYLLMAPMTLVQFECTFGGQKISQRYHCLPKEESPQLTGTCILKPSFGKVLGDVKKI